MNKKPFRATIAVMSALAILSLASPSSAQQAAAPTAQQVPARPPPPPAAPPAASDATAAADAGSRPLKSVTAGLRELSPWSMFLTADILVKAVMIGLAFASLVTWTIFIAKIIELALVQRGLRAALGKIADARSLGEPGFFLGPGETQFPSLLARAT